MKLLLSTLSLALIPSLPAAILEVGAWVPDPCHFVEISAIYQDGDQTYALYDVTNPPTFANCPTVTSFAIDTIEVDVPALSFTGGLPAALVDIAPGSRLLWTRESGQIADYDPSLGNGWVDSDLLGWTYLEPDSNWVYSQEQGAWIWIDENRLRADPGPGAGNGEFDPETERRAWLYAPFLILGGDVAMPAGWYLTGTGLGTDNGRWFYSERSGTWEVLGGSWPFAG